MTWRFRVPGQPVSWNHAYRDVIIKTREGRAWRKRAKTPEAEAYQALVTLIARTARPSGWTPKERVRLGYHFHLKKAIDADNIFKMLNDAIAVALGVNDKIFLPMALSLEWGCKEPYVEVIVK